ncbi:hypothetical protein AB9P05_16895 [Roseivirga sp. BDSF3-8]|uniref:hypothetical protein n=1 Tax=Roseivirga sp. BDSF3-8 TaxID=3241598 RepID=UPI0035320BAC
MPHFDLHCHPDFKSFLSSEVPSRRLSSWDEIRYKVNFRILRSQASHKQLFDGDVRLAVVPLYALEQPIAAHWAIKLLLGKFSRLVDFNFMDRIGDGTFPYFNLMTSGLGHLASEVKDPGGRKKLNFLSSINDLSADSDTLNIVLSVEGGHNFFGNNAGDSEETLSKLEMFKSGQPWRLFYITLTHLMRSGYCNQAFGMKLINDEAFYPAGKGVSDLGKAFIRKALSSENGQKPILIDIKHMSAVSRMEYYALRKAEFPHIPIMASHMGVTGCSRTNPPLKEAHWDGEKNCMVATYHPYPALSGTKFNSWSINLYDEDITEIAESNGLIGLSLDQRIMGVGKDSPELFSQEEWDSLGFAPTGKPGGKVIKEDDTYMTSRQIARLHLRYLLNNLLHIVKVGRQSVGDQIWDQVCIGSDFDGLIDPIDYCRTSAKFPDLKKGIEKHLPEMASEAGLSLPAPARVLADKIMYKNGLAFLQKHFV